MNKAELVNAMATETGVSKKDVEKVLNSFINVVSNEMANKGKVQLVGFGTAPAFKAGKALKDKVNK